MAGIDPRKWLEKIDDDQNLKTLLELDDNRKDQRGRHFFHSQEIHNHVLVGRFNVDTGKIEFETMNKSVVNDTTSAAQYVLTCPAGHRYTIKYLQCYDNTSGVSWGVEFIDGAVVHENIVDPTAVAIGVGQILIGVPFFTDTLGNFHSTLPQVVMTPGMTMTTTATGFVALDDMFIVVVYEDKEI